MLGTQWLVAQAGNGTKATVAASLPGSFTQPLGPRVAVDPGLWRPLRPGPQALCPPLPSPFLCPPLPSPLPFPRAHGHSHTGCSRICWGKAGTAGLAQGPEALWPPGPGAPAPLSAWPPATADCGCRCHPTLANTEPRGRGSLQPACAAGVPWPGWGGGCLWACSRVTGSGTHLRPRLPGPSLTSWGALRTPRRPAGQGPAWPVHV